MKKVLFALSNMNIGGTEKSFLNLVDTLSPEEYEVTLLLLEERGGYLKEVPSWVNIKVLKNYQEIKPLIMEPPKKVAKKYASSGKIFKAANILFRHAMFKLSGNRSNYYKYALKLTPDIEDEYDVAIAYAGPFDFITMLILEKVRAKKKIQWIHFDVSKFFVNQLFMKKNYPEFDQIYTVSEEGKRSLLKLIPEIESKTSVRYNVISKEKCLEKAKVGDGFDDDFEGIRILTVGRLSEEKGQDIIPEIALRLKESEINFRWYLIGEGKLRKSIEERIVNLDLTEQVMLLGLKENPYPFYNEADIYVQTSVHEGFCITLGEALAFGLPIVSTKFAGAEEQLKGENDHIITERDSTELSQGVLRLINQIRIVNE